MTAASGSPAARQDRWPTSVGDQIEVLLLGIRMAVIADPIDGFRGLLGGQRFRLNRSGDRKNLSKFLDNLTESLPACGPRHISPLLAPNFVSIDSTVGIGKSFLEQTLFTSRDVTHKCA
ncbi:hypothetical protein [Mycolicibacterium agri]|uniref:hypothetical protein n=1 Tax=Mycolicibacterium agri TaxID=36811 RepID=UPI0010569606|nr:hypothetical protein [Mycolicibacterium agri]